MPLQQYFSYIMSVLFVEETWVSGENHLPAANDWQTLSHKVVLSTPCQDHDGPFVIYAM